MTEPLRLVLYRPVKPKKRVKGPVEFSIPEALARADQILAGPCAGFVPRVPGRGVLVFRFVLPLDLCKTTNSLISMMRGGRQSAKAAAAGKRPMSPTQKMASFKDEVYRMLRTQHPELRAEPLKGRPMIRAVRFSSADTDAEADGLKTAIDLLRQPKAPVWDPKKRRMVGARKGLAFIVDDSRKFIDRVSWWEKVPPGKGFGLLEIWDGKETT